MVDGLSLVIGLALSALVAAYVLEPLLRRRLAARGSASSNRRSQRPAYAERRAGLEAEYAATLAAIRELDFDFQTGKLLEEDYRALREPSIAQGTRLLKELDQLAGDQAGADRQPVPPDLSISDGIEVLVQARRQTRPAMACPACRHPVQPDDRFCGRCGASLEARP